MASPTLLTRQPFKTLYALWALWFEATIRLPLSALLYLLFPSLTRPEPRWTWRQAIGVRLLRAIVHHSAEIEVHVPLSLAPGAEGSRFVVMEPAEDSIYRGPLVDDDGITRPEKIGGTWYSEPYTKGSSNNDDDDDDKAIVLHFHGGAFVLGDGRDKDCGHLARTMLQTCGASSVSHVFCPQYRLAGAPTHARYPAALQDALTSYLYLLRSCRIPASRIIVSGDSAGGNIVNGLLRYLATYGAEIGVEPPACAWLWSPWTNPSLALDAAYIVRSPNYPSDYISTGFGAWGARVYAGHREGLVKDVWISAVNAEPYHSPSPVWMQTGGRELLFHDNVEFFEGMKKVNEKRGGGGQPCELEIVPYAPHDIALTGHVVGFTKEYAEALKKAEAFFQRVRK
ncbi:Alpha beta hydrolase fold-3 domain containing protein [Lasiodiplodia theobromae]|uniref:Alpha beta hydrolase fold-3 domain containing protein n=1 Tax=Lasiodiplodia theobromae TaxID=45133 RepID=UPI0015C39853|nr:Alpha beta hydrolase fold-3 domain containing protein [Lasiodiplodia theobromae]KAF4543216.1 Alpha beta hydrolase fold-3 domain containing protein [Lasiodiplodia theobromae]